MSDFGTITVRFADGPLRNHTEEVELDLSTLPDTRTRHTHAGLVRYEIAAEADVNGTYPAHVVGGDPGSDTTFV